MSSLEGEPSPKRRRISYSSASPSPTAGQTKQAPTQPHTPPLSDRMSPRQNLPGLGMQQGVNGGGSGSVTFPTPPSTAGFQSQMLGRGGSSERGGMDSEMQTPAAMEAEEAVRRDAEGDGDQEMSDLPRARSDDVKSEEHRHTNHERQEDDSMAKAVLPAPNPPSLYKLRTEPIPPSLIPASTNIISLYSLNALQASVARRDLVTGEKIVTLRKTYAGKIKQLGLEGKQKPLKTQEHLQGLVDPTWDIVLPDGRTMWQDQRGEALLEDDGDMEIALSKLDAALGGMKPGRMPKAEHESWKAMLGLDETAAANTTAVKQPPAPMKVPASAFLAKTAPATARMHSAPSSPGRMAGVNRPERQGKKRRYDESSYEGYDLEDGYSTGGVDDTGGRRGSGGGKRQKRKDFSSTTHTTANASSSSPPPFHQQSAGGGMVGVRSS